MVFDPNCKNMVPVYLATVRGGKYQFRRYPMQIPYAKVGRRRRSTTTARQSQIHRPAPTPSASLVRMPRLIVARISPLFDVHITWRY